jgi:DNA-binding NarL/FixJ family response regulator
MNHVDDGVAHLKDAVEFCRPGLQPELAWSAYDLARAYLKRGSAGDRQAAADAVDLAREQCRSLSMRPLLTRVEALSERIGVTPGGQQAGPDGLSPRELDVLSLVTRGFTNQDIAENLHISPHTVARHIHHILEKTGAANRAEATAYALRHNLDG